MSDVFGCITYYGLCAGTHLYQIQWNNAL